MRATVYLFEDGATSQPTTEFYKGAFDGAYRITVYTDNLSLGLPGRDLTSVAFARALAAALIKVANEVEAAIAPAPTAAEVVR
jgi:hypothetical protein